MSAGAPTSSPREPYAAVVVGGSAGSVDALAALLPALPPRVRSAMLVVLHLPRDRRSLLPEIFRKRCALPMREAQDQEPIEPGTVYFAPPDYHLLVDTGPRTALSVDPPVHFSRPSIDVLFDSAADLYGPRLVGILLSGANDDGAQGLARIRASGGLTIVQEPATAAMPFMPQAALDRTAVDHVLPPAGIASLLAQLHRQGLL